MQVPKPPLQTLQQPQHKPPQPQEKQPDRDHLDQLGAYPAVAAERQSKPKIIEPPPPPPCAPIAATMDVDQNAAHSVTAVAADAKQVTLAPEGGWFVYVLRCSGDKFYVGKSRDVQRRFLQHVKLGSQSEEPGDEKMGAGSAWTSRHEPLQIVRSFPMQTPHDEETTTIDLMSEKGIDNVRGGPFCAVDLPMHQLLTLRQRVAALRDVCYICGQEGHYAAKCPEHAVRKKAPTRKRSAPPTRGRTKSRGFKRQRRDQPPTRATRAPAASVCARCGRNSHKVADCFAKTDLNGNAM
jgi:hypothetical protein